jgi:hypothetical protein
MNGQKLRVFENRVLRRIFGTKNEEVEGGLRRLYKEELHNLYALPNIIKVVKLRRKTRAGYVAHVRDEKLIQYFGWKT